MMYLGECSSDTPSLAGKAFNHRTEFFTKCTSSKWGMYLNGRTLYPALVLSLTVLMHLLILAACSSVAAVLIIG
eukprot:2115201-Ditylum_brightwellii.AAC.1